MRVPGYGSISILLNSVRAFDEDRHHVGFEVLTTIALHFGLEPRWNLEVPDVPDKHTPARSQATKNEREELREELVGVKEQLAQLTHAMEAVAAATGQCANDAPDEDV